MSGGAFEAAYEYLELGFDPIPLDPGSKATHVPGWQRRDIGRLWEAAPTDANIGLRGGGGYGTPAFLDCDDKNQPGTFDRAVSWLAGLGYMPDDYPVIQTASGIGRQVYLLFDGALPGDSLNLKPEFGAGEFRYGPGAYVCAPPSQVGGALYRLLSGDLRQLPRLALADLHDVISLPETVTEPRRARRIPPNARALLEAKPESLARYPTRHQAEQAIIAGLINAGFDFAEVEALFQSYPAAGKYTELYRRSRRDAAGYLRRSWNSAIEWCAINESKARQTAATLEAWAAASPWPGRGGSTDRAVFLAHASIAKQAGKERWAASTRTLAELAATSHVTANVATARLCDRGLLSLAFPATAEHAGIYQWTNLYTTLTPTMRKCKGLSNHDAFRWGGLGKSCAEVVEALHAVGAATVGELAAATGRSPRTVNRALKKLSNVVDTVTGEYIPLVERDGDRWRALEAVDLEHVALVVGTAGAGKRQREKHVAERRAHKRALTLRRMDENRL